MSQQKINQTCCSNCDRPLTEVVPSIVDGSARRGKATTCTGCSERQDARCDLSIYDTLSEDELAELADLDEGGLVE